MFLKMIKPNQRILHTNYQVFLVEYLIKTLKVGKFGGKKKTPATLIQEYKLGVD